MSALSKILQGPALLPIIQAETPTEAVAIANAMYQGGICSVEVVLRTAQSLRLYQRHSHANSAIVSGRRDYFIQGRCASR
ncbi:hypothetical protein [Alishewanella longhuensis]